jgi:hypothetical protein
VSGPAVLGYLLAAVMIVTAVYCVSRLVVARRRGRPTEPDVDIVHVLMGVAMAGMLVPRLRSLPDGTWEAVFGAALAWFGWQAGRPYCRRGAGSRARRASGHYLPHLLASGAMLYMYLAVLPARTEADMRRLAMGGQSVGAIRFPALALVLALALFGYVMWVTDRLPSLAPVSALQQVPADAGWAAAGFTLPLAADARFADAGLAGAGSAGAGLTNPSGSARCHPSFHAPLSPRLAAGCEIVMGIAMGYMLIVML